ncbi:hypothetical protein TorRG33x02_311300 [Trema orientale]|uniref:Uncharacterized protein n=1 Tax=Trema orientale TaxID=63057 RepID=A0A2P5BRM2_TREOI|nr:hypothetical protein TorRG33x02_311300 [Trema orientale]
MTQFFRVCVRIFNWSREHDIKWSKDDPESSRPNGMCCSESPHLELMETMKIRANSTITDLHISIAQIRGSEYKQYYHRHRATQETQ